MKPAPFDYHAPRQLKQAAELLAKLPNAKILAGGQSLVPMMNFRYVIVDHLVDLGGLDELRGIAAGDGLLRIGAMTRQRDLEVSPEIAKHCPLMAEALRHVGHRQTRNRGTIGGSLAHADPAAELPAVCAAYDATIHAASVRGIRQIPFREFATGFMATALQPDEMIAAIDLPIWRHGHGHGFHEFARRQGDFAIAGRCRAARCRRRQCRAPGGADAVRRDRFAAAGRGGGSAADRTAARCRRDPRRRRRGMADRADFGYPCQRRVPASPRASLEFARAQRRGAARRRGRPEEFAHEQAGHAE